MLAIPPGRRAFDHVAPPSVLTFTPTEVVKFVASVSVVRAQVAIAGQLSWYELDEFNMSVVVHVTPASDEL
jgi:hypothetical protein